MKNTINFILMTLFFSICTHVEAIDVTSANENDNSYTNSINQNKRIITGTITDINEVPVIGVNIIEKGTTNGTVTILMGTSR